MVDNLNFKSEVSQDVAPDIQKLQSPQGELYLRFYVPSGDEFAFPATGIKEVIASSPERITSIPNASPLLLGTINLRGQVIWVADLGQFLGYTAVLQTERPEITIIALEDQETLLGLAIDRIVGMDWRDIEQLRKSTNVAEHIAPFVQGEWVLNQESNQFLRMLDSVAIIRSTRWAV